jgi:hypothetical protein
VTESLEEEATEGHLSNEACPQDGMHVSNTLGVRKGKVEGSSPITAIVISPAEPRALVGVCFLVAGRSQNDKAAMQARSLKQDKLTKAREVKLKTHQDS